MHLQGKELVSLSTQRSARALTVTALVVVLAKHYSVLPADLELIGVTISQTAVSGAIFWVIGFQVINHVVHWWGDFSSIWSWNSEEKVNGVARISAGSHILTKLEKTIERIEVFLEERRSNPGFEENYPDKIATQLCSMHKELSELKPSIESYRSFGAFYFFGWFLVFPIVLAFVALFWAQLTNVAFLAESAPHN